MDVHILVFVSWSVTSPTSSWNLTKRRTYRMAPRLAADVFLTQPLSESGDH